MPSVTPSNTRANQQLVNPSRFESATASRASVGRKSECDSVPGNRSSLGGVRKWLKALAILLPLIPFGGHEVAAQSSEVFSLHEFVVEYVVVDGTVRQQVSWRLEILQPREEFLVDIFGSLSEEYTFEDVVVGDMPQGSVVNDKISIGDQYRYHLAVALGDQQSHFFIPGPTRTDVARFPGPPAQAPPDLAIEMVAFGASGTSGQLVWGELTDEATTGYTDILGYEIEYRFRDGSSWTATSPAHSGTARTYDHVLTGAEASQSGLQYRLRATNLITELENSPQGPWSEAVSPTIVGTTDLNADGWVGADDSLILYYSLELGDRFVVGTDRSSSTAGPLMKTLIGGLLRSTEVTDTVVLAAWDRALLLVEFGDSFVGGINATPGVDADDALILYYASAFRDLLGDGNSGGFESLRRDLLTAPSGLVSPTDEPLKAILRSANAFLAGQN